MPSYIRAEGGLGVLQWIRCEPFHAAAIVLGDSSINQWNFTLQTQIPADEKHTQIMQEETVFQLHA